MFQKQIFITSSRFGALQNFLVAVFFHRLTIQKKYDKNSIDLAYFAAATSFCILMASVNNHRKCYDIYLPLRCHKHFGLLVSHLCPIFGSVIVNLVTIAIGQATGRLQNIAIFQ